VASAFLALLRATTSWAKVADPPAVFQRRHGPARNPIVNACAAAVVMVLATRRELSGMTCALVCSADTCPRPAKRRAVFTLAYAGSGGRLQ
jgi:hypothetical protein